MVGILLDNVSVDLPVYDGSHRSFRRAVLSLSVGGVISSQKRHRIVVRALDAISLSLGNGDRIGLIGHNGAGKSTLLRVLAGIYEPTAGDATIQGRVSSLLSMASILDPEMTGYENIDHARVILGMPGRYRAQLRQDIEEFTELGPFLNMPIKTYSAGMQVRLSFGLLTAQEPDILLLDEALGAGDAAFVHKAASRVQVMCNRASILVVASHVQGHIRRMCNKVVWLDRGRIRQFGPVDDVLAAYGEAMQPAVAVREPLKA